VARETIARSVAFILLKSLPTKYRVIISHNTKANHKKQDGFNETAASKRKVSMYRKHLNSPHPGQENPVSSKKGQEALKKIMVRA